MSQRDKLTPTEQYLAYLIGLGIAIAMLAFVLAALGIVDNSDITNSMLIVGLAFIVLGVGLWLALLRPWEHFDDLQTPQFTGHKEHAEEEAPPQETAAGVALKDAVPTGAERVAVKAPAAPVKAEAPAAAEVKAPPVEAKAPAAAEVKAPPAKPKAPTKPDDLTLIEGIGPKTSAALAEAGITTFAQVAAMTPDELVETARAHGARVSKADTWPEQARQAAAGSATELGDTRARIVAGVKRDELTKIEGIGPKSQEALYKAGFQTYKDIANASLDTLRDALVSAGLKSLAPDTWPEQAGLIVKGDLTALQELQDRLRGGRE